MIKATDTLLKDHRLIRKTMEGFKLDNPRFLDVAATAHRIVVAHAWFEDVIFLPALKFERRLEQLSREITVEHQDIAALFTLLRHIENPGRESLDFYARQICSILETHFRKEEDALFPLSEKVLDAEGLNELGEEMRLRQKEVRGLGLP
jgi:hemerythrin-like domain-containing protein